MTVVDLFCGAGGFSRGFHQAGFKTMLAIDVEPDPLTTFHLNFPETMCWNVDIRQTHGLDILKKINLRPTVVIASPPCEPFTLANQKRISDPILRIYDDPRGRLVLHAIRIIGDLEPDYFVIENVVPLKEGKAEKYLRNELKEAGYGNVYFNVLKATEFGLPSERKRIFISNIRLKKKITSDESFLSTHYQTVEEALKSLPDVDEIHDIPNHFYVPPPTKLENKIPRMLPGQALAYFRSASGKTYLNYVRLHPNKPAPTVQGLSRFIHPWKDRLCSPREHARLMSFPDQHVFAGSSTQSIFNQVGEAVPPALARSIAMQIKDKL